MALNDVLDEGLPLHPLQEQRDSVRDWRQIGLGIMGLADMLIKMEVTYGSPEAVHICDMIGHAMADEAIQTSAWLAAGESPYPNYNKDAITSSGFYSTNALGDTKKTVHKYGLRNSQLLTIAPTGTLSTMLGISGGIEPIYANYYTRKTESLHGHDEYYKVYTPIVQKYMTEHGLSDDSELPDWFVTAQTLDYHQRIDMQAIWQKHIDASISSTVNVPNDFTVEQVEDLYMRAWEKGLKGVTIYRDGCKRSGILTTDSIKKEELTLGSVGTIGGWTIPALSRGMIIKADDNCVGKKRTLNTGCGTLHCQAFFDPDTGDLLETYLSKGSTGGCVDAETEYFNGHEWKKISDYKRGSDEKVLQYNENGTAELVKPIGYIVNDNVETLKHFTNHYGLDMVLSEDHRMFVYKNYCKFKAGNAKKLTSEIITVSEYLNREGSKSRHVPTTFQFKAPGIPIKHECIRLLVAIYADGTWDGHKICISLKKSRKKDRLRELLKKCNIGWSERDINNTEYTCFYFYPIPNIADWFTDKQFTSKWYDCTDEQLKVVIDECVHWDGSVENGNRLGSYYSSKKQEIDFIQFALARLGYRGTISLNNSATAVKDSYRIRWTKQNVHNLEFANIEDFPTIDGRSYCFTVPSGLLVLRRNNKIFITGNCNQFMIGLSRMISLAARGGVDVYSIVDQLKSSGTCPSYAVRRATKKDTSLGSSCPVAIGNALVEMYEEMQEELGFKEDKVVETVKEEKPVATPKQTVAKAKCPECGGELVFEGGCSQCLNCGYSRCE